MRAALSTLGRALRQAERGATTPIDLLSPAGVTLARMDVADWSGPLAGDDAMLDACTGATLDVGCGPGRMVLALRRRRVSALGIDISAVAVRQARRHGADALVRDVFGPVPGGGTWRHALLADGNIGIGGHPQALLRRIRQLVRPGGIVLADLASPQTTSRVERVRLRRGEITGDWFAWATVSATDIERVARAAGFASAQCWTAAGRWLARLT